jgi:hypothetical protein
VTTVGVEILSMWRFAGFAVGIPVGVWVIVAV